MWYRERGYDRLVRAIRITRAWVIVLLFIQFQLVSATYAIRFQEYSHEMGRFRMYLCLVMYPFIEDQIDIIY